MARAFPLRPTALLLPWTLAVLAPLPIGAQETTERPEFGTIFKSDVDGALGALRKAADPNGRVGSVRTTAQLLTAMGHCHRFYSQADGPVVRPALAALFGSRRSDGSFASADDETAADRAVTTSWAIAALAVMEPELYRSDVRQAEEWLKSSGHAGSGPWAARLAAVRAAVARGEGTPPELGRPHVERLRAALGAEGGANLAGAVDALVDVVACQTVARELDSGTDPAAAVGAEWWPSQQAGVEFLLSQQEDGSFFLRTPAGDFPDPGVSALALAALQSKPAALRTETEQAVIEAGLQKLLAMQNDDGSFAERNANYTTCAAVLALAKARRAEFGPALEKARRYLLGIQNIEDRGYARSDRDYGSIGYGGDQRGDLSNLQFAVQALREAGLPENDEALAKAVVFLQRTQNKRDVNDFSGRVRNEDGWQDVVSGDDGGAAYYPGNSPAGYVELPDGKSIPRSYGSMTYSLLKCYILAGIPTDDPRVQAAVEWIEANWSLDVNPGSDPALGEKAQYQGLYYYYMVLAQALDEAGIDSLSGRASADVASAPPQIQWRTALRESLEAAQNDDGAWLNQRNDRWWEDKSAICTIYALLALERCQ